MIKSQESEAGDFLPDFGVENDEDGYYKKYRTNVTEFDAMYILKAMPQLINTSSLQTHAIIFWKG